MDKHEFFNKMMNEYTPRRLDEYILWEAFRQGMWVIEDDSKRYSFYEQFYQKLDKGELKDDNDVAKLSYKIRTK